MDLPVVHIELDFLTLLHSTLLDILFYGIHTLNKGLLHWVKVGIITESIQHESFRFCKVVLKILVLFHYLRYFRAHFVTLGINSFRYLIYKPLLVYAVESVHD